jgi:hypothetical protein
MAGHRIRCFILQADAIVTKPHWRRLYTERQEHLGHDQLDLFIDLKHNRRMLGPQVQEPQAREGRPPSSR